MKAVIKADPSPGAVLAEVDKPSPGLGEVLIKVAAASVCGTDLDLAYNWETASSTWGSPLPLILGHECSGYVAETGSEVSGVNVGDLVVVETHIFCGDCAACLADAKHNCLNMAIPGVSRDGVFAEFVVVPARACYVVKEGVEPEVAVLYEAAGVAVHATQRAGDIAGKTVALTGAGPVGLFLIATLRALGAEHVVVMEPNDARRERASELGAATFRAEEADEFVTYCQKYGKIDGADVAFDVSGAIPAYDLLFRALGKESTLVSVGHTTKPLSVNISRDLNVRVITWKGTFGRHIWSSWDIVDGLVRSGQLNLNDFIVEEIQLDDLPTRLTDVASLPGKVIVRP
jgi:threonine 3-dehydrogenase